MLCGKVKSRKLLVHMAVSRRKDFLHDHELYEMMRSRQLFNVHVDLKKELNKTIRGIQDAERVNLANIEAEKILFLQRCAKKAKERLKLTRVDTIFSGDDENDDTTQEFDGNERDDLKSPLEYLPRESLTARVFRGSVSRDTTTRPKQTAASKRSLLQSRGISRGVFSSRPYTGFESSLTDFEFTSTRPCTYQSNTIGKSVWLPDIVSSPRERAFAMERELLTAKCDMARNERLQKMRDYRQILEQRVQDFKASLIPTDTTRLNSAAHFSASFSPQHNRRRSMRLNSSQMTVTHSKPTG